MDKSVTVRSRDERLCFRVHADLFYFGNRAGELSLQSGIFSENQKLYFCAWRCGVSGGAFGAGVSAVVGNALVH